jgi:UDP-glucose 4-epimerase
MKKAKHILVTGGAGFIGSHLVERLLNDGKSVVIVDDLSTGSRDNLRSFGKNPRLKIVQAKISECAELSQLAAEAEFIFHLAATVGVDLVVKSALHVLEASFNETQMLLRAAAKHSTPLLLTSTSEVYGKSAKPEFSEDDDLLIGPPGQSRWSYACSKLTDEFLALAYAREKNLPVTIARLFNTVGPRQTGRYGMVIPRFTRQALSGEPLTVYGTGKQIRCFCHVHDVVPALTKLAQTPAAYGQAVNLGSTEQVNIETLAQKVIAATGSPSRITRSSYLDAYGSGYEDMQRRVPDCTFARSLTGFRPVRTLGTIIRDVIQDQATQHPVAAVSAS